jgi:hypothetical protein
MKNILLVAASCLALFATGTPTYAAAQSAPHVQLDAAGELIPTRLVINDQSPISAQVAAFASAVCMKQQSYNRQFAPELGQLRQADCTGPLVKRMMAELAKKSQPTLAATTPPY